MDEEDDEDIKRMKAELAGECEDDLSPEAAGLPPVAAVRIGEGGSRSGGLQALSVVPSSPALGSRPDKLAPLFPDTLKAA
ncbi:unnamed protein product [Effrenium voratum]|nr:unnamed protein product [Effrenium voratum]